MADFDRLTLRTGRLLLRPLRDSDASAIFAIRSNRQVMRYASSTPLATLEGASEFIARDAASIAAGEILRLGLERVDDQAIIGTCILFHFNHQCRRAEIGYELRHDAWGRGYMHEALVEFVRFAFTELALNRIEADIDPRNIASARSLERQGFSKEGLLRQRWIVDGEVSDSALYGLLHEEWLARHSLSLLPLAGEGAEGG